MPSSCSDGRCGVGAESVTGDAITGIAVSYLRRSGAAAFWARDDGGVNLFTAGEFEDVPFDEYMSAPTDFQKTARTSARIERQKTDGLLILAYCPDKYTVFCLAVQEASVGAEVEADFVDTSTQLAALVYARLREPFVSTADKD